MCSIEMQGADTSRSTKSFGFRPRRYTVRPSHVRGPMPGIDDNIPKDSIPTEEIYLELEELEALAAEMDDDSPTPVVSADDPSSIKARIARLRATLSDRGAPIDE